MCGLRISVQVHSKTRLISYIFGFEGIDKLSSDKSTTSFTFYVKPYDALRYCISTLTFDGTVTLV